MCLDKIKEHYDNPSMAIIDGWKTFNVDTTFGLKFTAVNLNGKWEVPMDRWIKADPKLIQDSKGKDYFTGFHVYTDEDKVKKKYVSKYTTPYRVYIRKVTCLGEQDGLDVYIAQEMYVPTNQDEWPPKDGEPKREIKMTDLAKETNKLTKEEPKKRKSIKEIMMGKPGNA